MGFGRNKLRRYGGIFVYDDDSVDMVGHYNEGVKIYEREPIRQRFPYHCGNAARVIHRHLTVHDLAEHFPATSMQIVT